MPALLQMTFTFPAELMGEKLTLDAQQLAHSITQEPGFISKVWTENATTGEAGGIYIFSDQAHAKQYATMHQQRVAKMGATDIQYKVFDINTKLTDITFGQYQ